jgi:hypothetical protein
LAEKEERRQQAAVRTPEEEVEEEEEKGLPGMDQLPFVSPRLVVVGDGYFSLFLVLLVD